MSLIARTHRIPGASRTTARTSCLLSILISGFIAAQAYSDLLDVAPTASIEIMAAQGMAPFTAHVHALESDPGIGTPPTARYEWDFGDAGASYTVLEGFNAAHIYDEPGVYEITLRVTNEIGQSDLSTVSVTVLPDARSTLYVAANGSNSNPGTSPSQPLATLGRAMELLDDDMKVLLRRGDVFEVTGGHFIDASNVVIGAYGAGARPKLNFVGSPGYTGMLVVTTGGNHYDIVIQDLHFDSIYDPDALRDIADGFLPAGVNNTIRRCEFGALSLALNCNRNPIGLLAMDNVAPGLAAYFSWAQGTDHVYLGNTVGVSYHEHDIRLANTQRVLIAHNDLTNFEKTTIWAMLGYYVTVTDNHLYHGRMRLGPNPFQVDPSGRFRWALIQRNVFIRSGGDNAMINVLAGAEHAMIRNNVIKSDGRPCITVAGYDPNMNRTCLDIDVLNNTGINDWPNGRFFSTSAGAADLTLCNNLYVAPALVTGTDRTANVYVESEDLDLFTCIANNVWTIPADFAWVPDAYHYVWPFWSNPAGYKTPAEWAAYSVVSNEEYENVELGADYAPPPDTIAATHAQPLPGVFTDLYGNERPMGEAWSAGAVEVGAGGPIIPPGGRVTDGLVVLYGLDEGGGATLFDVSGVGEPMHLTLGNPSAVTWVDGGISILSSTIIESAGPAIKITDACQATDEITIEAWIVPVNLAQSGPARIVTLSDSTSARNFTLGQAADCFDIRLRTTNTDPNGVPACTTPPIVATEMTHVVHTRSASEERKCYVDGIEVEAMSTGGSFQNWSPDHAFALANELSGDRPWRGEIHLVAVYDRALDGAEVEQNFQAGANPQVSPYDLNADGVVNVLDMLIFLTAWGDCPQIRQGCDADLNGDGVVGALDLVQVLSAWGQCAGCPADLNNDGTVNLVDLLLVLTAWGDCEQMTPDCPADFNGDGVVGVLDLLALLSHWSA